MPRDAGNKPVTITYYEYDPTFPTEFTLSLAGVAEVNGDHVASINFGAPGVSWTMVDELGAEVAIPNSFLFTSAGEEYKLRARGSLPVGLDTWTYAPIPYSVNAAYAPAWAQLIGEITPTVNRSEGECTLTEPITTYAPASDQVIAAISMSVANWPFGGISCGVNANCFGGTVAQAWTQQTNATTTATITVATIQGDTAFLQRAFDISNSISTVLSIEQMAPTITTHYRIWKECGSRTIHYEWYAVREAGTGSITWNTPGNVTSNETTTIGMITSRVRLDLVHYRQAGQDYSAGAWYMGASYSVQLQFVAHD